jgi:hypothetical protein
MRRMTVRRRGARAATVTLICGLALPLAGCSLGSTSPDAVTADTALPTPSPRVVPPDQILGHRVGALLAVPAVSVDEDLQTGATEVEVRLTWAADGSVVDATSLPIGAHAGVGTEVFRTPGELLERPAGVASSCWSPGGERAARFDQRVVQEVAVLRSARATSGSGDLWRGTVSAPALLRVLGSPGQLRAHGLSGSASGRVPATFATTGDALEITTGWGALARAAGSSKATTGTWLLQFRPFGTAGPRAPSADMMCP